MSWTAQGNICAAGSNKTDSTSITTGAQSGYAPVLGDVIVVELALDNTDTTQGIDSSLVSSVTDTAGNTYTKIREYTAGRGVAKAGTTASLWACLNVTTAWGSSDTITANLASTTTAKVIRAQAYTPGNASGGSLDATTNASVGIAADPASMSLTPAGGSQEYLWLYALAAEGPSGDTDTVDSTNGWTRNNFNGTSGGSSASNQTIVSGYKISTASSLTVDWTHTAEDYSQIIAAITENAKVVTPGLLGTAMSTFTPKVAFTVSPGQLGSAMAVFTPSVTFVVKPGLLGSAMSTFTPVVNVTAGSLTVSPGLLGSAMSVFAPTVTFAVKPALLGSAMAIFAPAITLTVKPGLLGSAMSVFAPVVGTSRVYAPVVSMPMSVFTPSVAFVVQPGLLGSPMSVFVPIVGTSRVYPPVVAMTMAVFTPSIGEAIQMPLLGSPMAVFDPKVALTVFPGLLGAAMDVFTPTVLLAGGVSPPVVAMSMAVFDPLVFTSRVYAPLLGSVMAVYAPVVDVEVVEQPLPPMYDPSIDGRRPRRRDSLSNPRRAVHRKGVR